MAADWQKIKIEYITTDISLRQIAQQYGLRYATVHDRCKKEDWNTLRDKHRTGTVSKSVSVIRNKQVDKITRIDNLADKLLEKLEKAVDELDMSVRKRKKKSEISEGIEETTEWLEAVEVGIVDRAGLKQITAALKDLKEIQMIVSELDKKEQEARINKLQKEAAKDDRSSTITVTMEGDIGSYGR